MADSVVAAGSTGNNNHTGTGALYNPEEAGAKLKELDALVPQVAAALHQEKFQQVQAFLKKNNELIQAVMAEQAKALAQEQGAGGDGPTAQQQGELAGGGGGVDKALLQQCAGMIKELNDNLTQVYDIYAELAPVPKEE